MKRNSFVALLLVILLLIEIIPLHNNNFTYADVAVDYTGQTNIGTYRISTTEQLNMLAYKVNSGTTYVNSVFLLQNNIVFDSSVINNYIPIGGRGDDTKFFSGTFDGQGYSIKGINILHNKTEKGVGYFDSYIGIFGYVKDATIRNLGIEDSYIDGFKNVGGIAGCASGNTLIENCFAKNITAMTYDIYLSPKPGGYYYDKGYTVGNIVGINYGIIKNCTNYSLIMPDSGSDNGGGSGGIAGENRGTVEFCYNYGGARPMQRYMYRYKDSEYYSETPGSSFGSTVAGIVGFNLKNVNDCVNYANMNLSTGAGIVSQNGYYSYSEYGTSYAGNVLRCFNTGNITGHNVGGIVNFSDYGTVEECYNTGNITGSYAAGIQAGQTHGNVNYCYNTGNITGMNVGGIGREWAHTNNRSPIYNSYNLGTVSNAGYESWGEDEEGMRPPWPLHYAAGVFKGEGCYNTYFLNTSVNTDYNAKYPTNSKSATQLKDLTFINTINNGTNKFIPDTMGINSGFPIFKWQLQIQDIKINGNTTVERGGITTLTAEASFSNSSKQVNSAAMQVNLFNNILPKSSVIDTTQYNGQTEVGIYYISTIAQMDMLSTKVNSGVNYTGSTFILQNDLIYNSSVANITPIGTNTSPFMGKFNGNGFVIKGVNNVSKVYNGLFGYIKNAEIKDLTVSNSTINCSYISKQESWQGSIAGYAVNSIIINCNSNNNYFYKGSGMYTTSPTGCILGYSENSTIEKCKSNNNTFSTHNTRVGGIVGEMNGGTINECSNNFGSTASFGNGNFGGIVGVIYGKVTISSCSNLGNMAANGNLGGIVGSIDLAKSYTKIGNNLKTDIYILNSYNKGTLNQAFGQTGGILGAVEFGYGIHNLQFVNYNVEIDSCYNSGNIRCSNLSVIPTAAGIIGGFHDGGWGTLLYFSNIYIRNCYNTGNMSDGGGSNGSAVGGITGNISANMYNSYNIGTIIGGYLHYPEGVIEGEYFPGETHYYSGGLSGHRGSSAISSNSYYLDTTSPRDFGDMSAKNFAKTSTHMKSKEFLGLLNSNDSKFVEDIMYINNGYPILKWQQDKITYNWRIENSEIASITPILDNTGVVLNGLRKGETILHVSATYNGKTFTKKITITVVNPTVETKEGYYLVGEEIEYFTGYYDDDNDPKYRDEFKYIHSPNRLEVGVNLDNTLGQISYNDKWLGDSVKTFGKVGAYEVSYRVQDNPPTANKLGFENYRYYSQSVSTTIYIHRKPIAWFNIENNKINDSSYDLDHSVSYSNKGIVKWEWTYINDKGKILTYIATDKATGINTVNNWLSSNLGVNYELILRVQDMELAWSDIYSTKMKGEINFSANLRTELEKFDLVTGVPASENILAFDIWTRYTDELRLELVLCDTTGKEVAPVSPVKYSSSTATRIGQDTYWNDVLYNIPVKLKSDKYIMKIKAIDERDYDVFKEIPFKVNVKTPIDLQPIMPGEIRAGKETQIYAKTSKYVNSAYTGSNVKVTLFEGTSYARTLTMNGTTTNWDITITLEKTIPQGVYKAKFVATLPSGEFEVKELTYNYVVNTAPVITDGEIFAELGGNYIYENDDVNFRLKFHDVDLSSLTVDVKLYNSNNLTTPIRTYTKVVSPNGSIYDDHIIRLIDDIPLGDYRVVATVTDDYNESATITKDFTAHDLWITGTVTHTDKWEENRQNYNTKYPLKVRDKITYWNGESFETNANTTIINKNSNVVCNKVSIEIINSDRPSDNRYLQWLNSDNITNDKWKLSYWNKEWIRKDGYVITKWGSDKKQELTLRFTAYFNNDWVETYDVKVYIDNQDDYWKLHRAW